MLQATIIIDGILCDYRTRLPLGITDGTATIGIDSVVNASISVMDAKIESGVTARQRYIENLNKDPKAASVLAREYFEKNHKASLSGFRAYSEPSNGGVEQ